MCESMYIWFDILYIHDNIAANKLNKGRKIDKNNIKKITKRFSRSVGLMASLLAA